MSITFACEQCGKSFTVDHKFGGKEGKCKRCGATMSIPSADPSPTMRAGTDVYGFEDQPAPTQHALPDGIEDFRSAPPGAKHFKPAKGDPYAPPGKQNRSRGVLGTAVKVVLLSIAGLFALGIIVFVFRIATKTSSRGELAAILKERVDLNQQLAELLSGVNDVAGARAASPRRYEASRQSPPTSAS